MAFIIRWLMLLASSQFLRPLLIRLAVAIGISTVTYEGVGTLLAAVDAKIAAGVMGAGAYAQWFLEATGVETGLNLILSAYVARLTLQGLTAGGVLKKAVLNPYGTGTLLNP